MERKSIKNQGSIIDYHIHIGQFYNEYYDPVNTIKTVVDEGFGVRYSSTTSCVTDVAYTTIAAEIEAVQTVFNSQQVKPYLWYCPQYKKQGISVENAMNDLPYWGLKIHPRANDWNLENTENIEILHELFDYAHTHTLPVLVHTGYDKLDEANKFSSFFAEYTNAQIILAHCRPIEQTVELLKTYSNIFCDTAFVDIETQKKIIDAGFKEKILFGSDFPITHYYSMQRGEPKSLKEQYKLDIKGIN